MEEMVVRTVNNSSNTSEEGLHDCEVQRPARINEKLASDQSSRKERRFFDEHSHFRQEHFIWFLTECASISVSSSQNV